MRIKADIFLFFVIIIFSSCVTSNNRDISSFIQNENYWKTIATAHQIVIINVSELQVQNVKLDLYFKYEIQIVKSLKGNSQDNIQFNVFMKEENYNFIMSLDESEKVIVFLVNTYDGYGYNNYLADYFIEYSIIEYTNETESIIAKELLLQNDIVNNNLYENFKIDKKLFNKVKRHINNTENIFLQNNSFERLEEMGMDGVPYIILLLDNFRLLPIKSITLRNYSANAFEGYRHYGPELVIDALTAILNQITGESFGNIENGEATQEERTLVLNGWRIYLYKLINNN
jgi:hypothetical protein